jgi:pyocin large subunit-like protein
VSSTSTSWAWQQRVGSPSTKLVLLAIAELAGGLHSVEADAAVGELVKRTELDRRTVQRHLRLLEQSHHIVIEHRHDTGGRRLANRWHLNVNELAPVPLDFYGGSTS